MQNNARKQILFPRFYEFLDPHKSVCKLWIRPSEVHNPQVYVRV